MMIGKGFVERTLSEDELREVIAALGRELNVTGKRILVIIPDGTRTMPMALLYGLLQEEIAAHSAACDYLVALGTHPLMSEGELSRLLGRPVNDGVCAGARVSNHRWDEEETFVEVGTIGSSEVEEVSGGLLSEAVSVKVNRMIFDYDQVLICGPVFPHEVVGFSGGNKYLFPGISGKEMIDQTHWLGALLGSYRVIGTQTTPVREMINRAAAKIRMPVACLALVVTKEGVNGAYFGEPREAWECAAQLSSKKHIDWVAKPFRRVLSVMPGMYRDIWTAAKGMYKVEPAMAEDGEVVVYAPHITEFSYTHGASLERIGYHCRDYFLKQWQRFSDVPRGVLAHSTHLRGQGCYDEGTGIERDRIRVTLATGISEERCRRMNLGYLNPAEVNMEQWQGREAEGIKLIPRAGEILFRIKE